MYNSEFDDAYEDRQRFRGATFSTPISQLALHETIVVDVSDTVATAVKSMNEHHTGCVLVQKEGKIVGIFTERDVLTRIVFRNESSAVKVESVMTRNPETLETTDIVAYALNKMSVGGYRHIPIVDDEGQSVGILSVRDIVGFLAQLFPEDIINLPPSPDKSIAKSLDGG